MSDQKEEEVSYPDQQYDFASDTNGALERLVKATLAKPNCSKVPVTYSLLNDMGDDDFKWTAMVPKAIIEKAKYDKEINRILIHCIAHSYQDKLMETARRRQQQQEQTDGSSNCNNKNKFVCISCQGTPTHFSQLPTCTWHIEPYTIIDMAGSLLCNNPACNEQALKNMMTMIEQVMEIENTVRDKTGDKLCDCCNKLLTAEEDEGGEKGNNLKKNRCSHCKKVYYCNRECQKRAWKNHKKVCKPTTA